jgi:hypothetical protein
MSVNYSIKAYPTLYNGRQYRSRLEAKWAAFFDRIGWPFEFEPYDLGAWSPDFLLLGQTPILVEVKPITDYDADTVERMCLTARDANWRGNLLLVGANPFIPHQDGYGYWLGWIGERWDERHGLGWGFEPCLSIDTNGSAIDFYHPLANGRGCMTGYSSPVFKISGSFDTVRTKAEALWFDACNTVQWNSQS